MKRLEVLMVVTLLALLCFRCEKETIPENKTPQIVEREYTEDENNNPAEQDKGKKETMVCCEVFGKEGYYLESEVYPDWYKRSYFLNEASGIPVAVCEGFFIDDYHLDIDNDGVKEILCNRVAGGDGHRELYVYKYRHGKIYIGYVNWLNKDIQDLFYWGCNAVQTIFDSDQNAIVVTYGIKDINGNIKTASINVSFDWLEFSEWDGKTRPFIDISKAYELYGNNRE